MVGVVHCNMHSNPSLKEQSLLKHEITKVFIPGSIETPTDVACDATVNTTTEEVIGKCGWKYGGDMSLVAYFNLQIFLNDIKVANVFVQNNTTEAAFTFHSSNQSADYKAVVYAIDHCNTWSQMHMGSVTIEQGNTAIYMLDYHSTSHTISSTAAQRKKSL